MISGVAGRAKKMAWSGQVCTRRVRRGAIALSIRGGKKGHGRMKIGNLIPIDMLGQAAMDHIGAIASRHWAYMRSWRCMGISCGGPDSDVKGRQQEPRNRIQRTIAYGPEQRPASQDWQFHAKRKQARG